MSVKSKKRNVSLDKRDSKKFFTTVGIVVLIIMLLMFLMYRNM